VSHRSRWFKQSVVLVSLVGLPLAAQVKFQEFVENCNITSMSADGSVAVGSYGGGSTADSFRWTAAGGVELIGVKNQFLDLYISRDGRTIVGTIPDSAGNYYAAVWQGGRNWKILPPFAGVVADDATHNVTVATGVSGDGSVIIGSAYIAQAKIVAFRWDAVHGMVNLGTFDQGSLVDSQALSISADGRNIVGWDFLNNFAPAGPGGVAMNSRRGAIWWDGHERLLHPFGWAGEAWVTNAVGSIIAGQFHPLDANNAPITMHGASTYLWTAWDGHFEDLGAVKIPLGGDQSNYISQPYAMSDDGSVVGGETGRFQKFAMIWTRATGMVYVSDFLTSKGVTDHLTWTLGRTVFITPDGRLMVGYGLKGLSPAVRTWIVNLK